jgi:hypothetical protein
MTSTHRGRDAVNSTQRQHKATHNNCKHKKLSTACCCTRVKPLPPNHALGTFMRRGRPSTKRRLGVFLDDSDPSRSPAAHISASFGGAPSSVSHHGDLSEEYTAGIELLDSQLDAGATTTKTRRIYDASVRALNYVFYTPCFARRGAFARVRDTSCFAVLTFFHFFFNVLPTDIFPSKE